MDLKPPSLPAVVLVAGAALCAVVATARLSRPALPEGAAEAMPVAQRVIFISLDTLRQNHLSLYGYPRPTSPNLERFAERCVVFDNAMSQAPYTLPSHMSMFTGLYPQAHGVRHEKDVLGDEYQTLAESLLAAGYRTAAFTDAGFMHRRYGFDQGFEDYDDVRAKGGPEVNGFRRYLGRVKEWIERHQQERFFLFLHTFDTHGPYFAEEEHRLALRGTDPVVPAAALELGDPMAYLRATGFHDYLKPEQYATLADLIDVYDATIHFVDQKVGEILDLLAERNLLDDALVIITSDHGEAFLDHRLYVGHGLMLYEEEIRVPLLVKFPGDRFAGTRSGSVVRLIDLFPTVAASCRAECPPIVQGVDLVPLLRGHEQEPRTAAGESPNLASRRADGVEETTRYVRRRDLKYIEPPRVDLSALVQRHLKIKQGEDPAADAGSVRMGERVVLEPALYDLARDPAEQDNLAARRPRETEGSRTWLEHLDGHNASLRRLHAPRDPGAAAQVDLSDEEIEVEILRIEQLMELGYLDSGEAQRQIQELRLRQAARRTGAAPDKPGR